MDELNISFGDECSKTSSVSLILLLILFWVEHITIQFHSLLKGDTQVILEYQPVGSMILEYYAAICAILKELNDTQMTAQYCWLDNTRV